MQIRPVRLLRSTLELAFALVLTPYAAHATPDLSLAMSLDTAVPASGQVVEFTVEVTNSGTDAAADVVVKDKLPAELAIPTGLAAFTDLGTYEAATGDWTIASLGPGLTATLVIPAVVTAATPPPCIANVATTSHGLDTQTSNNRAVAAVRQSAEIRCVDLSVAGSGDMVPDCQTTRHLELAVRVTNLGPDEARDVLLDASLSPTVVPGLRFADAGCTGTRCAIASLPAGSTATRQLISNDFQNTTQQTITFSFAVSSLDTDYATTNNQTTASGSLEVFDDCGIDIPKNQAGSGPGCFIATAAYGSALDPHVAALRGFRDRVLERSGLGRAFVRFYYRLSPPIAAVIARHEWLRSSVRFALTPLVLAIAFPLRALALLLVAAAAAFAWLHARRRRPGFTRPG
jgi:uncharacterized repeat protein (TIGR01451 family)